MEKEMSLQEFHKKLQVVATEKGIPIFGGFELTPRCNLSCKMCYVKYKGASKEYIADELTTKQWIELGHAAADNGALIVFLTGGEPLMRDDFKEIYESYSQLGFRLNLFTNATLINDEFAKWLSQIPPATVDVTLYGSSEDTYFNLCGQKSAYSKAINGIELLLKNNINTRIKTTIVRTNVNDYENIEAIAKSYGIEFIASNLIHGNRTTGIVDIENIRLSPEEICRFNMADIKSFDCSQMDIEHIKQVYKGMPPMACSAGRSSFFINWKGHMVPCPLFETPYSEPLLSGYKNAWDTIREQVKHIPSANECTECDYRVFCPVCPARLYLETGRFDGHSDYVCQLAKEKSKYFNG